MSEQSLIKSNSIKDMVTSDVVKSRLREIMGDRGAAFGAALVQIVKQTYSLQKCKPDSVIGAALTAAALDLSVDPNLGEAHLIPYGDQCQFQIGFKGFIQLAMRSGEYKAFGSTIIHEGELQDYDELTGELVLTGKKNPEGRVIGYAAKFKLLNGFERAEFWTCDEIERHAMQYSKSYRFAKGKPDKERDCLWITKRDEMAIKTVEKSLLNHYGPKSIQMKKAITMDGGAILNADTGELEYIDNTDAGKVTSPQFDPPPTQEAEVVSEKPKEPPQEAPPAATPPTKPAEPKPKAAATVAKASAAADENAAVKHLRLTIEAESVKVEKVLAFLVDLGVIENNIQSLEQLRTESPETFSMLKEQAGDILARIKNQ